MGSVELRMTLDQAVVFRDAFLDMEPAGGTNFAQAARRFRPPAAAADGAVGDDARAVAAELGRVVAQPHRPNGDRVEHG